MKFIASPLCLLPGLLLIGVGTYCTAETFNVKPEAGLWQSESEVLIDGRDVLAEVKAMQAQMMAQLPEEARLAMGLEAPSDSDDLSCLSAEQASAAQDVDEWLDQLAQEGCSIQRTKQTTNSIEFQASCDASSGVTGTYTGRLQANSSKSWVMSMQGKGSLGFGSQPVQQEITVSGKWLQEDCGDIKP